MQPVLTAPTPTQIAAILERAMNLRFDVQKAMVRVAVDDPSMLLVDVQMRTAGSRRQIEARAARVLERGETVREIIDSMLGSEPDGSGRHLAQRPALLEDRRRWLDYPLDQVLDNHKRHQRRPVNPPPPASRLPWPQAAETQTAESLEGQLPTTAPGPAQAGELAQDQYRDPVTNQVRPKMRRRDMLRAGMTQAQRAEQYRIQRGPHPEDGGH